jgi:hypothetical protein
MQGNGIGCASWVLLTIIGTLFLASVVVVCLPRG